MQLNLTMQDSFIIYSEYNGDYKKIISFSEKNIDEIYNELNIDNKIIENYFIYL